MEDTTEKIVLNSAKLLKVTLEFEDRIMSIEGDEAEKWRQHNRLVAVLASTHGNNPFWSDPIKWNYTIFKDTAI